MSNCVEKCEGCKRKNEDNDCLVYPDPNYWWEKRKGCPLCTTLRRMEGGKDKVRVGQQKSKKKKTRK